MFGLPKAEHFKSHHFKTLTKNDHPLAIADHITATGHNIKWDHFDILASGNTDYHCKIKETMFKRRGVYDPGGGEGYSHTLPIRVCAVQRGRDFEAPDLERRIHFRSFF